MKRLQKEALYAFIILLIIVLACRHAKMDHQQTQRIEELERRLEQLAQQPRELLADEPETSSVGEAPRVAEGAKTAVAERRAASQSNVVTTSSADEYRERAQQTVAKLTEQPSVSAKFDRPVAIELNSVDSATLVRVPGIGASTALAILRYRQQLGGFYSAEQLREKLTWESAQTNLDKWCKEWFVVDKRQIKMLSVNSLSFKDLLKHPYLNYEQVKALCNYRDRNGSIGSMENLRQMEPFAEADLVRLAPYLSFE